MNKITIEINGETLTIPDDEIDAVTAELTERFGKRDGFVYGQRVYWLDADGEIIERQFYDDDDDREGILLGNIYHTKAEAIAAKKRRLAQQRLRKAYLAVTGGAEIVGEHWLPVYVNGKHWDAWRRESSQHPFPYRFATAEQAAAFGRDNGEDLRLMMTV